jgi:hypothetical protein
MGSWSGCWLAAAKQKKKQKIGSIQRGRAARRGCARTASSKNKTMKITHFDVVAQAATHRWIAFFITLHGFSH